MTELQNALYGMLCDIDALCREHKIEFFLVEGTALGAKREGGFIPWDDDLDIAMTRENYYNFKAVAMSDTVFCEKYFYQDYKTDKNYPIPFAKIRKNGTLFIEEGTRGIDMHQGIYIDIFPIDFAVSSAFKFKIQLYASQLYEALLRKNIPHNPVKRAVLGAIKLFRAEDGCKSLFEKIASNKKRGALRDTSLYYSFDLCPEKIIFQKDEIFPGRKIAFETGEFIVFNKLEAYLERRYGDYMTLPSPEQREKDKHAAYFELETKKEN